ncbi:hypothetical protein [Rhodococcus rhodochrous]|uniref:hypothetical protein n=1 Tax=Rhodococcus rhodochrous TaxID=1829 RepID=UPI000750CFD0|nr:hypothetical protein [Rhodococcus rhodochrous]MCB8912435.1 hypothetical protein [Rhodococcus rhodochrous]MDJ0401412.1 hypothetical protein [Rhodococcus rhodochrous]MDO1485864.1 hypothetical protein [Rhodococcus rhodochrous]SNV16295.1 Uncharacterised protein [Rhodococcus rhodochrous]
MTVELPCAAIPVRGRVDAVASEVAVTALLLAGVVTGGTVMVREPLGLEPDAVRRLRAGVARTGAYVVASADGLTATTRSTAGELPQFDVTVPMDVLPLYAVAATRAGDECALSASDGTAAAWAPLLVQLGLGVCVEGESIVVAPGLGEPAGVVDHDGDVRVALTALLVALLQPGVQVVDTTPLDVFPGFLDRWTTLLEADEYLLPGSALLPSDYVVRS